MSTIAPIHPGEVLMEEFLTPLEVTQNRLAVAIGVPPRRINEIVHGKRRVTADPALRLASGTSAPLTGSGSTSRPATTSRSRRTTSATPWTTSHPWRPSEPGQAPTAAAARAMPPCTLMVGRYAPTADQTFQQVGSSLEFRRAEPAE